MFFKRINLVLLVSLSLFKPLVADGLKNINLHSEAAILIDPDTREILYQKNAFKKLPPASITKVSTLVYALKKVKDDIRVPVKADRDCVGSISKERQKALNYRHPPHWQVIGGTHLSIHHQEVMMLEDLLYGMILVSANDAANMVAKHVTGNIPNFMKELNSYMKSIGCKGTQLKNPHGMHYPDHLTTAYDMALITCEGLKDPRFCKILKTKEYAFPPTNKQKAKRIYAFNKLIKPGSSYYYPYSCGGKTGFNNNAKNTLVAVAKKDGKTLVVVLLKCKRKGLQYEDAHKLFKKGFEALK